MSASYCIVARTAPEAGEGEQRRFTVEGQIARTLKALVDAGPKGVTSLEISSWALRTSHYVFVLRHRHGLNISMDREDHDGPAGIGWHGRYRLLDPVEIIEAKASRKRSEAA